MVERYNRRLPPAAPTDHQRRDYLKWLRYYLDFCAKYRHPPRDADSLQPFLHKLAEKHQTSSQQAQAASAVRLFLKLIRDPRIQAELRKRDGCESPHWDKVYRQLKECVRVRQYSPKTLQTYSGWVRRFQTYLNGKEPAQVEMDDVKRYLSWLATDQRVAASTQNQAFNSLLFLFRHVFHKEFDAEQGIVRAKRKRYIPVVCSREEMNRIIQQLHYPEKLVAQLLYGCGLRLFEALNLRVQCFNFDEGVLTVHDGKGKKDRAVPLPAVLAPDLETHLARLQRLHERDLSAGYAGVFLPAAFDRKAPGAAREFPWQWFFPARTLTLVPETGEYRRYHLHETHFQKAMRAAVRKAKLTKRVTAHTFQHSFASHLLQANYDIRTIQQMLGHSDVRTTMIYTHTLESRTVKEMKSPLDFPDSGRKTPGPKPKQKPLKLKPPYANLC